MTNKEAIKQIEDFVRAAKDDIAFPHLEAFSYAVSALEKQVPKKITEIHCDEYHCPKCGAENLCDQYQVTDKFCPNCGQALDWSD